MKLLTLVFAGYITCALCPVAVHAQANMFDHEFWHAYGTRDGAQWGGAGLDTIGFVNDTIRHAISIAESRGNAGYVSSYVYNRTRLDTVRHFEFPGQKVYRGSINGDPYMDAVCLDWGRSPVVITVLFGTSIVDSFTTALVITGENIDFTSVDIVIADADGDGYGDIFISDRNYQRGSSGQDRVGRMLLYKGGPALDSTPALEVLGRSKQDYVGGYVAIAHLHDDIQRRFVEVRRYGDTLKVLEYPLISPFRLAAIDSSICTIDTNMMCCLAQAGGFAIMDVDGDGIDDICISAFDTRPEVNRKGGPAVIVYRGGATIGSRPQYVFHSPNIDVTSSMFGSRILDIGDVVGRHYHSILVTDPGALLNSAGAVFMYNVGAALKDSCVAYALGPRGSRDEFGIQAISPGDLTADGRSEIMIGSPINADGYYFGTLWAFKGDSSYGPAISGVRDGRTSVSGLDLSPCYPNPANSTTDISFAVTAAHMHGAEVTIKLYDMLGREVGTVYRGGADAYRTDVRMDVSRLTPGAYTYRLVCGTQQRSGTLTVVR